MGRPTWSMTSNEPLAGETDSDRLRPAPARPLRPVPSGRDLRRPSPEGRKAWSPGHPERRGRSQRKRSSGEPTTVAGGTNTRHPRCVRRAQRRGRHGKRTRVEAQLSTSLATSLAFQPIYLRVSSRRQGRVNHEDRRHRRHRPDRSVSRCCSRAAAPSAPIRRACTLRGPSTGKYTKLTAGKALPDVCCGA